MKQRDMFIKGMGHDIWVWMIFPIQRTITTATMGFCMELLLIVLYQQLIIIEYMIIIIILDRGDDERNI